MKVRVVNWTVILATAFLLAGCSEDTAGVGSSQGGESTELTGIDDEVGSEAESSTSAKGVTIPEDCAPVAEVCNGLDDDCDGEVDEGFADEDGNGTPDCLDGDNDADLIPNEVDNCPDDENPNQFDKDFDSIGDVCDSDLDGDGIENNADNCLEVSNPDQKDTDGDGEGARRREQWRNGRQRQWQRRRRRW